MKFFMNEASEVTKDCWNKGLFSLSLCRFAYYVDSPTSFHLMLFRLKKNNLT